MKITITDDKIREYFQAHAPEFPKYTTPLLNLANQYAQGTRPQVVGQMSELIQEFPGRTLAEWKTWYLKQHPDAIGAATDRIVSMVEKLRIAMGKIDTQMIRQWVEDLVIVKTFVGLSFQGVVLAQIAEMRGATYRFAQPNEEARGIDGFVGDSPISIKPYTYKSMDRLPETIKGEIVFYRKTKKGIVIEFDE